MGFSDNTFEVCEVVNKSTKEVSYVLRSELRVHREFKDIPEGVIIYAIRGADDDWCDATIEKGVLVNHNADLILHPELSKGIMDAIEKDNLVTIYYDEKDPSVSDYDFNFINKLMTYEEFMKARPEMFE